MDFIDWFDQNFVEGLRIAFGFVAEKVGSPSAAYYRETAISTYLTYFSGYILALVALLIIKNAWAHQKVPIKPVSRWIAFAASCYIASRDAVAAVAVFFAALGAIETVTFGSLIVKNKHKEAVGALLPIVMFIALCVGTLYLGARVGKFF